jgi:hypothetical protein
MLLNNPNRMELSNIMWNKVIEEIDWEN